MIITVSTPKLVQHRIHDVNDHKFIIIKCFWIDFLHGNGSLGGISWRISR